MLSFIFRLSEPTGRSVRGRSWVQRLCGSRATRAWGLAIVMTAGASGLRAQSVDDLLFTVGTRAEIGGQAYGYAVWQSTATEAVFGREYAIYQKEAPLGTTAPMTRLGIVRLQEHPRVIQSILRASEVLDRDFAALEPRIDAFLDEVDVSGLSGGSGLDLAGKISLLVRGAKQDAELFQSLYLLGRQHPGLNTVLGLGFFREIPSGSAVTWEIREWNPREERDLRVAGRVQFDGAGAVAGLGYAPLPAVGEPVEVPYPPSDTVYINDPKGHLNVRLRWATPEAFRRQSLLALGFDLYRVRPQSVQDFGWHGGIPLDDLEAFLALGEIKRVNTLPITPDRDLTIAAATDLGDLETYFAADDNDRFQPSGAPLSPGVPFKDGEQFYYFVAARDLLGRPGLVSPGTLVTICDRMPPSAVPDVVVRNFFVAPTEPTEIEAFGGEQHLEVVWEQVTEAQQKEDVSRYNYYVYRWTSTDAYLAGARDPLANLVAGPLNHQRGQSHQRWVDRPGVDNPDAPALPGDASRTFWYTVRVEDASVCGGNLSAHSAPVYGVLRDRRPLEAPGGSVVTRCLLPQLEFLGVELYPLTTGQYPAEATYTISVVRRDPAIEWVELEAVATKSPRSGEAIGPDLPLGRQYFRNGDDVLQWYYGGDPAGARRVSVQAGDRYGNRSNALQTVDLTFTEQSPVGVELRYEVTMEETFTDSSNCGPHRTNRVDSGGVVERVPVVGDLRPTARSKTYKIYRRVDGGPLGLLKQGETNYTVDELAAIPFTDDTLSAAGFSEICYFGQVFDEHGNASQLARIRCIEATTELPTVLLAEPVAVGGGAMGAPAGVELSWYAAPVGVDRFEVWVAVLPDGDPGSFAPVLERPEALAGPFKLDGEAGLFFRMQTPRLATSFGVGAPEFRVQLPITPGVSYRFAVRAVGRGGFDQRPTGPLSQRVTWDWREPTAVSGPTTPWPARPLPPVTSGETPGRFSGPVGMEVVGSSVFSRLRLRVGEYALRHPDRPEEIWTYEPVNPYPNAPAALRPYVVPEGKPEELLYRFLDGAEQGNPFSGRSLLPFALYRYQSGWIEAETPEEQAILELVYGFTASSVDRSLHQVTPLLESIAHLRGIPYRYGTGDPKQPTQGTLAVTRMMDPFFLTAVVPNPGEVGPTHYLYVDDRHATVLGAKYRYLMVLFTPQGEIERVVPLPEIAITF